MDSEEKQKRRHLRVPVRVMIRVRSEQDAEIFTTNYSGDLSLGGMFVKTFSPRPIGTAVHIQLPFPKPPGYVEIMGRVVNHQEQTSDGLQAGMGIHFIRMDTNARYALQQFINGNWRGLFKKPLLTTGSESETLEALSNTVEFISRLIYFPDIAF